MTDMNQHVESLVSEFNLTECKDDEEWTILHFDKRNNTPSSFNYDAIKKLQSKLLLVPTTTKITLIQNGDPTKTKIDLYVYLRKE